MFKKFMNDSGRKERRSSSCSVDEPSRHSTSRRQREPDCSKYLTTPRATQPPKWVESFYEYDALLIIYAGSLSKNCLAIFLQSFFDRQC
ncbi:unnamed protein product [Brugia timori]|nr:unnamed protein product [Brugia timori]